MGRPAVCALSAGASLPVAVALGHVALGCRLSQAAYKGLLSSADGHSAVRYCLSQYINGIFSPVDFQSVCPCYESIEPL